MVSRHPSMSCIHVDVRACVRACVRVCGRVMRTRDCMVDMNMNIRCILVRRHACAHAGTPVMVVMTVATLWALFAFEIWILVNGPIDGDPYM